MIPGILAGQFLSGSIGPPVEDTAYRYWRVNFSSNNNGGFGGSSLHLIPEMQMFDDLLGSNICSGGTAIGQQGYASGGAEDPLKAFDGSSGTWWQGTDPFTPQVSRIGPTVLGYDFGLGNEKTILKIGLTANGSYLDRTPRMGTVEASQDGVLWVPQWFITIGSWSSGSLREFVKPTEQLSNQYWMVYTGLYSRDDPTLHFACAEMKFYAGGTNVTSGGSGLADVHLSGYPASNAFDGNTSSFYHSNYTRESWLGYNFGIGNAFEVNRVDLRARGDYDGQAPTVGRVMYSQDGTSWLPSWGFVAPTDWATGEERSFLASSTAGKSHWRVLMSVRQGGTGGGVSPMGFSEIQFRENAGVSVTDTNRVVGIAIASSVFESNMTYAPAKAFNGLTTDEYVSEDIKALPNPWLGMAFTAPRTVVELSIKARTTYQNDSPETFSLQYSEDGGFTWVTKQTYSGLSWTSGETKLFTVT